MLQLDHDLIIKAVRWRVADGTVLTLIRKLLESGVMTGYGTEKTEIGSPQGSVISPLMANIYLDSFDQFMRHWGLRIVRYADDILIFKASRRSAENALQVASDYLENTLKLSVNMRKTQLTAMWKGVSYLQVKIHTRYIRIKSEKLASFKDKIKAITRRNTPINLKTVIRDLKSVLRDFGNYFRVCNCKHQFRQLMCWVRHRLGAIQLKLWKKPAKRHRRLRQLAYNGDFPRIQDAVMAQCFQSTGALGHAEQLGIFDLNSL